MIWDFEEKGSCKLKIFKQNESMKSQGSCQYVLAYGYIIKKPDVHALLFYAK